MLSEKTMAPPCSPTTQKSDFFKITVICFIWIAIIHQWSLAEIATTALNKTVHTSPRTKLVRSSLNQNLTSVVKKTAHASFGTNLTGKSQNANLKPVVKKSAIIASGKNKSGTNPNPNLVFVVKKTANTSFGTNTSGLNPNPNLFEPMAKQSLSKHGNDDIAKGPNVAEQWNESTKVPITERRFVASENNQVFILGVVAKNSTPSAKWDKFAVYGQWYDHKHVNESGARCCFKYADGTITEHQNSEFDARNYKPGMLWAKLMLFHITCDSPPSAPLLVSIARHYSCNSGNVTFIKPYFAMKKPDGHIVITTKMAYRYVNPETMVGFLETARYLGVGKVITYVMDSLEPDLKKIMRYYAHMGILDYYTIELAQRELVFRRFPPVVNAQYRCDEWIVKRDALERNMGSTYFGIFDMDEYLVPSRDRSLKQLLSDLLVRFPNASHFFFPNVHYLTDGDFEDPVCAPDCSMFRRHTMTSPQRFNSIHEKMLLVTSRVVTSTVTNHRVQPMPGFARVTCPDSEAYIRHYGKCFRKFTKPICSNSSLWIKDTTMVSWAERTIHENIQKTRKILQVF